jgi:ubiquitin-conjugating enzyme E2 O
VDRGYFARGDFCKRSRDDAQSGVVLNARVEVKIQHAITTETIDRWFDKDEFRPNQPLLPGDYVVCDNWVGQVSLLKLTTALSYI